MVNSYGSLTFAIELLCCPLGKHKAKTSQKKLASILDVVHSLSHCGPLALVNTRKKLISMKKTQQKLMRFTIDSVAVHFRECCGPLSFKKKLKKDNKNFCEKVYVRQKEIMKFT